MKEKSKPQPTVANSSAKSAKLSTLRAKSSSARSQSQHDPAESFEFLVPPQKEDELGRLGHYRVLKVLGRGGMGIVFLAEDERLHRLVALKVMLPAVAKKKTARTRFKREALVTAKIEHDNIVTIYEVSEDHDLPYLAMQFLKGMTLDDWLKTGKKLKISQILRIGKETARGLAAAHACHLIHRDIKPSNIWLDATNKGRVKILDFGLARPTNEDIELTHQGTIIGTPAFMSPEQARGETVDARSDLFSLGGVLYRLCSGRFAFNGQDALTVLYAIINEDPPPVEFANPEVPPALAQLIHQLLEKAPADRPASASAVVEKLQNLERAWIGATKTLPGNTLTPAESANTAPPQDVTEAAIEEEDSAISQHDLTLPAAGAAPAKSRVAWIVIVLSLAFTGFLTLALALAVSFYWFATNHGQVRCVAADDVAQEVLHERGVTLEDQNKKKYLFKGDAQPLPPGEYTIDAASLPESLQVEPKSFTLHRGDTQKLTVQMVLLAKLEHLSMEQVTRDNAKKLQQAWASVLARNLIESNSIGMKMVLVPAGVFSMGSTPEFVKQLTDDPKNLPLTWKDRYVKLARSEVPLHKVHITRPFALGMYEVTVEQFQQFADSQNYRSETEKAGKPGAGLENGAITRKAEFTWKRTGFNQTKDHPVTNLTWGDAEAFCKWLSKKENKFYRLPSEAEWEFACRAGSTSAWYFGDAAADAGKYMHYLPPGKTLNALSGAHAVGGKLPNDFGLFDMHGNVEEMCADTWSADYYEKSPFEDPTGPHGDFAKAKQPESPKNKFFDALNGKFGFDKGRHFGKGFGDRGKPPPFKAKQPEQTKEKVARGGSFLEVPQVGRSAFRNPLDATVGQVQLGFRVVCEITLPN